jgi:hypothetical protein
LSWGWGRICLTPLPPWGVILGILQYNLYKKNKKNKKKPMLYPMFNPWRQQIFFGACVKKNFQSTYSPNTVVLKIFCPEFLFWLEMLIPILTDFIFSGCNTHHIL